MGGDVPQNLKHFNICTALFCAQLAVVLLKRMLHILKRILCQINLTLIDCCQAMLLEDDLMYGYGEGSD